MKTYITFFTFMAYFFVGIQTSHSQDKQVKQIETSTEHTILEHQNAKDQTFALHKVVNLSSDQVSKVNDMFLTIEKKQQVISAEVEKKDVRLKLDDLEAFKKNSLEEILTESQYSIYLKSIQ